MDILTYYRTVAYIMFGLIGLAVGSFLNVVIYRLPNGMSLATPPSHCPKCGYKLSWYDNIPVLSYLFLGGKCRSCKIKISPRYITIELLNCALWLISSYVYGFGSIRQAVMSGSCAIACSVLLCLAFIDAEHKIIFDRFHIMLIVLGLCFGFAENKNPVGVVWNLVTGIVAFGVFWLLGYLVSRLKGQEALGGGDIKLAFCIGLYLGVGRIILTVLIASLAACVFIVASQRKDNSDGGREYPFGPFLSFGFIVAMLFGNGIINIYLRILGI